MGTEVKTLLVGARGLITMGFQRQCLGWGEEALGVNGAPGRERWNGGQGRLLKSSHRPWSPQVLPLCPARAREGCCLDYTQTNLCVLFSGFPAWGCRAGADHQGAGCVHCAH